MSGALRNPVFRWIASLLLLDSLLEWFGTVALMALIYDHTHSATVTAGLLVCKQIAPGAIVPMTGSLLDRLSVGRGLMFAFALQAATLVAIGLVGYGVPLFLLAVSSGIAGTLVRSLLRTGFARVLPGEALRGGNAFASIGVGVTGLIGPALAAVCVSTFGTSVALLAAGACMFLSVAIASRIPQSGVTPVEAGSEADEAHVTRRATSNVSLNWLLVGVTAMIVLGTMDEPALLAYSERSLDAGIGGYGAFLAAWGVGMTLGGLVFSRLLERSMLAVAATAAVVTAVAWLGLSVAPTIAVAGVFAVLGGLGNGVCWIALVTAVQEAAPMGKEGSTATRLESIVSAAPAFGIVIGGVVSDLAGPRATFLIPGVVAIGLMVAGLSLVRARGFNAAPGTSTFSATTTGGSA